MNPNMRSARLGKLTGSRAAVTMGSLKEDRKGLNDYVQELAFERVFGDPEEDGYRSKAMERGNELEPRALVYYEFARDALLEPKDEATGGTFVHPVHSFVAATPDGVVLQPRKRVVEAKCFLRKAWMYAEAERKVPAAYRWQCRWEQWVLGADVCDFVVWHPKGGGFVIETQVNADEIEQMTARAYLVNAMIEDRVAELRNRREAT